MSFEYFLENESYKYLPALLLARDYGIQVIGELIRSYVPDRKEGYLEVNILGEAVKKMGTPSYRREKQGSAFGERNR